MDNLQNSRSAQPVRLDVSDLPAEDYQMFDVRCAGEEVVTFVGEDVVFLEQAGDVACLGNGIAA